MVRLSNFFQNRDFGFDGLPSFDRVGFFIFIFFLFVMPLSQAFMNLSIAALIVWWLSSGNVVRDLRACPLFMKCFLLFSVFPVVTIFTSDFAATTTLIMEMPNVLKIGIVLLPVYTLARIWGGDSRSTMWVIGAMAAGGVVASIEALVSWNPASFEALISWNLAESYYPAFLNTGGANRTSAYMVLVATAALAAIVTGTTAFAAFSWVALLIPLIVLLLLESLISYAAMACIGMAWVGISVAMKRYGTVALMVACPATLVLAVAVTVPDGDRRLSRFSLEIQERIHGDDRTSGRDRILRTALEITDRHPWFGAGPDQFANTTSETRIRAELRADGRNYDMERDNFLHITHGHSVWTHVLVERGWLGIVLVATFFVLSAAAVAKPAIRVVFHEARDPARAALAFLSVAAWTALFVGGIGNTALHYEDGRVGLALLVWSVTALALGESGDRPGGKSERPAAAGTAGQQRRSAPHMKAGQ